MKVLSVGPLFQHEAVTHDQFGSGTSLLDYDLFILDPSVLIEEYWSQGKVNTFTGYPVIDDRNSVRLKTDIRRRQSEMYEMLKQGRTIVVFTPPPQRCHIAPDERDYPGDRLGITKYDLHENLFTPILFTRYGRNVRTVEASGRSIEFRGEEPFAAFWEKNRDHLRYTAYFEEKVGKPQWFIEGTTKVVGTYLKIKNGNLIFLPSVQGKEDFDSPEDWLAAQQGFIDSLIKLADELKRGTGDVQLPAWTQNYLLPGELEQRTNLSNLQGVVDHVHREIAQQKENLDKLNKYKLLIGGTGKAFDTQVAQVLEELGFTVKDGLLGRDDIFLSYEGRYAIVQTRSISRSATVTHAAQLEKCVSEYFTPHEIDAKGILVVNAFKDLPLEDRSEPAFPSSMVSYSEKRNHCLLTGAQLLNLYLMVRENPQYRTTVIEKLLSTNGVFDEGSDATQIWRRLSSDDNENAAPVRSQPRVITKSQSTKV